MGSIQRRNVLLSLYELRRSSFLEPFEIRVPESDLADLGDRLERVQVPPAAVDEPWDSGVDYRYMAELLGRWRVDFDWRRQERWLNSFSHYLARIDGMVVHFVQARPDPARYPDPIPVILSHGWPYSFVEFLPLVPYLTDPGSHGVDSERGFTMIIPSLPGYGYSSPLMEPFTGNSVAALWNRLMREVLGYRAYITYGEDVGAGISDWLGAMFPDNVAGIFATHPAFPPEEHRDNLTEAETDYLAWLKDKWRTGRGYSEIQSTRPDTLAVSLQDSPAGLLAWIVEKLHEWSGPDFEQAWSPDEILTTASLYWFTRTIGTSFLPYYYDHYEPALSHISVPVGVAVNWADRGYPREYAERTYLDIRTWSELPRGGHFTAKQTPQLVASGLASFARTLV